MYLNFVSAKLPQETFGCGVSSAIQIILSWMYNVWMALQIINFELKLSLEPSPYRADTRAELLLKRLLHRRALNLPKSTCRWCRCNLEKHIIGVFYKSCITHLTISQVTGDHAYTNVMALMLGPLFQLNFCTPFLNLNVESGEAKQWDTDAVQLYNNANNKQAASDHWEEIFLTLSNKTFLIPFSHCSQTLSITGPQTQIVTFPLQITNHPATVPYCNASSPMIFATKSVVMARRSLGFTN